MQTIEVGGKLYTVETSGVTIGDFMQATEDAQSKDKDIQGKAFNTILRKSLGDQLYLIPIANYTYVLSKVVEIMIAPFSSSMVDDEMREILEREEDEGV